MPDPVIIPVSVVPVIPTQQHHDNLSAFLHFLSTLTQLALVLGPAVAAPFIKNPGTQAIVTAELPAVQALSQLLGQPAQS